jgi:hypothetical protein
VTEFLPRELQTQLDAARRQARRKRASRVVHVGDEAFPILDYSETGFAVDAADVPRLRGLIDIFDGPRHLSRALIVASARDGDLMRYEYKCNTPAAISAPVDFERDAEAPSGLLSRE